MFTFRLFQYVGFITVALLSSGCHANETIIIETAEKKSVHFNVQVARTDEEKANGLMFVQAMPKEEGMLFLNKSPQRTLFWMKNTLIPLDMLFFDNQNRLVHIEHMAMPHDETPRGVWDNLTICSVLEINGGIAKKENIDIGAKIITNLTQECLHSPIK